MVQEEPDAERPPLPAAAIAAAPGTLIDDSVLAGPGQAALSQSGVFIAAAAFGAAVESPIVDHPAGLGQVVASQAGAAVGPSGAEAASSASAAGNPNPTGTGDLNPYQMYMWEAVTVSAARHYMVDPHQDLGIL